MQYELPTTATLEDGSIDYSYYQRLAAGERSRVLKSIVRTVSSRFRHRKS